MEGSIHVSVNSNEGLNLGEVEALVDVRHFTGKCFMLKNSGMDKKVTAVTNYSVRTNEAKAMDKILSFLKHLDDY